MAGRLSYRCTALCLATTMPFEQQPVHCAANSAAVMCCGIFALRPEMRPYATTNFLAAHCQHHECAMLSALRFMWPAVACCPTMVFIVGYTLISCCGWHMDVQCEAYNLQHSLLLSLGKACRPEHHSPKLFYVLKQHDCLCRARGRIGGRTHMPRESTTTAPR